uniref:Uncharacterized protein n=1 Tax=Anguilla anguilla TaxID=7936 RepID=A0A0E9RQ99_ANGAN
MATVQAWQSIVKAYTHGSQTLSKSLLAKDRQQITKHDYFHLLNINTLHGQKYVDH